MREKVWSYIRVMVYILALSVLYAVWHNDMLNENIPVNNDGADEVSKEIKRVAITFDDGPHSVYTEMLLDGLKERNVVATFFVVGRNISENEYLLQRMKDEGHLIGNHTYTHVELSRLTIEEQREEISKTNEKIEEITGEAVNFIRPPFGGYNKSELQMGTLQGMYVILWDIDPKDWCIYDKDQIVKNVIETVENENIILLHDIFGTSVEAALEIVDILKEQGYEFVTVDELVF